jgi:hypothetical protein
MGKFRKSKLSKMDKKATKKQKMDINSNKIGKIRKTFFCKIVKKS